MSYLNSLPMVWGLRQYAHSLDCELTLSAPAGCLEAYARGEAEVTLVPSGGLSPEDLPRLVSNFCIGASGPVETVCLHSNQPIERLRRVWIDPHSRTSVRLLRLLAEGFWRMEWQYDTLDLYTLPTLTLKPDEGVLLIGDKVFSQRERWSHSYDLSEMWRQYTGGLPFVFAAWVRREGFQDPEWCARMNEALAHGVRHRDRALAESALPPGITPQGAAEYLAHRIDYALDADKLKGLQRFLDLCQSLGDPPRIAPRAQTTPRGGSNR